MGARTMQPILPRALRPGDEVAIIAPASGVRDERALEAGLARWREFGFEPVLLPHALERQDWPDGCPVAAHDAGRAADLQLALSDPRYRAVVAVRGGYGVTRLLPGLDLTAFASDPKPVLGYSDLTALLAAVHRRTGCIGFHGPMLATSAALDAGSAGWRLQRELLTRADRAAILPPAPNARMLVPGVAEGPLVGGNLSLVQALVGTPDAIATRGALVFLEDTGEAPYRIDRMLTHLLQVGFFDGAAGVLLGDFHADHTAPGCEHGPTLAVLEERLRALKVPVGIGFPFGHLPESWTLPYGAQARLTVDTADGATELTLLQPAVRA